MTDPNTDPRHVGSEAGDDIRRSADRLAQDARSAADDLGGRARDEAWQQADRAKGGVASEMSGIAQALRKAAEDMRSGSPQERTFGQIAEGLADASDMVRDRDVGQLAGDVSQFARRNPLAFLGGAALAGFAVSRFAKASSAPQPSRTPEPSPGQGSASAGQGSAPSGPDTSRIPGPATTPTGTTPGVGATTTATPSPHATRTPGDF